MGRYRLDRFNESALLRVSGIDTVSFGAMIAEHGDRMRAVDALRHRISEALRVDRSTYPVLLSREVNQEYL